jgi:hypothetical protein
MVFGRQHAEFPRAAVQGIADAEGCFPTLQVERHGVVPGQVVAQRFVAMPSPSEVARVSVAVDVDSVRKTEKSDGAEAVVPMEAQC